MKRMFPMLKVGRFLDYACMMSEDAVDTFTVDFDASQNISAPAVRAFVPSGGSENLNQTSSADGSASFEAAITRDVVTVLLFKDDTGYTQTTMLLPVSGDVNSDTSCLPTSTLSTTSSLEMSSSEAKVTPQ